MEKKTEPEPDFEGELPLTKKQFAFIQALMKERRAPDEHWEKLVGKYGIRSKEDIKHLTKWQASDLITDLLKLPKW